MTSTKHTKQFFRPKVLVRAARIGLRQYVREKELSRILKKTNLPKLGLATNALTDVETTLENARREGSASYSIQHHVSVLTALLAEMHLLPQQNLKLNP